jgi:hypothetical protein
MRLCPVVKYQYHKYCKYQADMLVEKREGV